MQDEDIAAFVNKRDAAIKAGFAEFMVYAAEQGVTFSRREVAEAAFHKCRTGITSLDMNLRLESDTWLKAHGFSSFM